MEGLTLTVSHFRIFYEKGGLWLIDCRHITMVIYNKITTIVATILDT